MTPALLSRPFTGALLALLLLLVVGASPAHADRIFTTGAEENNATGLETMWNVSFSGMTFNTAQMHSGARSYRAQVGASFANGIRGFAAPLTSGTL